MVELDVVVVAVGPLSIRANMTKIVHHCILLVDCVFCGKKETRKTCFTELFFDFQYYYYLMIVDARFVPVIFFDQTKYASVY